MGVTLEMRFRVSGQKATPVRAGGVSLEEAASATGLGEDALQRLWLEKWPEIAGESRCQRPSHRPSRTERLFRELMLTRRESAVLHAYLRITQGNEILLAFPGSADIFGQSVRAVGKKMDESDDLANGLLPLVHRILEVALSRIARAELNDPGEARVS